MTDKSFGDHMNRNIVKNPLLSTAVTGLSIEDLTHNAVLLPVSHSQEVITRPDQHFGTQTRPLGHTEHVTSNFPSGDANSNPIASKPPSNVTLTPLGTNQTIKTEKLNEKPFSTQSKASVKSEDDFDVNEYFARLQGTRYVSAPLNSSIKEDSNANLEEREENLEEINLNEPEKSQTDIQQSLTADIAQNFSQLPTVLPQVASAVFSSFSNMLNLKSREHTPDDVKPTYRDRQMPKAEETVPLMGVSDVKEMAPPPKEPPTTGTSNYRLATKMRYAQIPGLSYSHIPDNNQIPFANIPISQNTPSYFLPSTPGAPSNPSIPMVPENPASVPANHPIVPTNSTVPTNAPANVPTMITNITSTKTLDIAKTVRADDGQTIGSTDIDRQTAQKDMYNFYNPTEYIVQNIPEQPKVTENQPAFAAKKVESNINMTSEQISSTSPGSSHNKHQEAPLTASTQSYAGIIPPPPMFSNLPRRDSQPGAGKMILPPSVARRISSGHPVIKPQAPQPIYPEKIFVPTTDSEYISNIPMQNYELQNIKPPSAFAQFSMPPLTQDTTAKFNPSNVSMSISSSATSVASNLVPNILPPPKSVPTLPKSLSNLSLKPVSEPTPQAIFAPASQNQAATNLPPSSFFDPSTFSLNKPETSMNFQASVNEGSQHQLKENPHPPTFFNSSIYTSNVPTVSPQSDANLPPPTFFDPSTFIVNEPKDKSVDLQPAQPQITPQFSSNSESLKPVIEPPKVAGNVSYRMTKKRPQYYSGPIEGFGSISNNVKPLLQPVGTSVFQGAVFTPPQTQEIVEQSLTTADTEKSSVSIDQSGVNTFIPFNVTQETSYNQSVKPEYDTAFDLSRTTTENYEPPKEESKGFGIIGSLKSKLSALDINKIQNSVTTFFDPAYNDAKKETTGQQENMPYGRNLNDIYGQASSTSYNQNSQNLSSNFEIFVPNVEQTPQPNQAYDYQSYQAPNASYNPAQENQQFYQQQHPFNYYQNLGQDPPTFSYYTLPAPGNTHVPDTSSDMIDRNVQEWYAESYSHSHDAESNQPEVKLEPPLKVQENAETTQAAKLDTKVESNPIVQSVFQQELDSSANSFFDITQSLPRTEEMASKLSDAQSTQNISLKTVESIHNFDKEEESDEIRNVSFQSVNLKPLETVSGFFETPLEQGAKDERIPFTSLTFEDSKVQADANNLHSETSAPVLDVSSVALLGLSTMLADKSRELSDLEHDIKTLTLRETDQDIDTIFNRGANVSFFDDLNLKSQESVETKELDEVDKNDLNMCETCREVIRPEDKDTEDLTTQLIENITAPIQLSNPVEVPLTESNTLVEDAADFNPNQCAEISHITEETIETIQVQSVTELLDEDQLNDNNIRNYGWCTDGATFTQPNPIDHNYGSRNSNLVGDQSYSLAIAQNPVVDHNYSLLNPSAIGFFGKDIFEDIPNNASDEIKAEFKTTHEDAPVLLTRQMSIPSAPPAEEDSKSDETGIDVHSIEQDAKKDFPIYDEFVIEPSETDDDKIECKEREKSSDEVQEVDSFTHRVERFKKLGEPSDGFDFRKSPYSLVSTTSPPVQMASYFDTGNYAADTHYKNSLTSSHITTFGLRAANNSMRIPPGFEEEYHKRLSGAVQEIGDIGYVPVPLVPDTSTQTRHAITPTFTTAQTSIVTTTASFDSSRISESVQHGISSQGESEHFPGFDSIFGIKRENKQQHVFREIQTKLDTPKTTNEIITEKPIDQNEVNKIFEASQPPSTSSKLSDFSRLININKEESPKQGLFESSSAFCELKSEIPEDTSPNESEKWPSPANVFATKTEPSKTDPDILTALYKSSEEIPIVANPVLADKPEDNLLKQYVPVLPKLEERLPVFAEIIGSKSEAPSAPFVLQKEIEKLPEKPPIQNVPILPDPINFFSSNAESSKTQKSNEDESFNRLASYFTSPTKTDSTKSFFELSLGQNHYRQDTKLKHEIDPINLGSGDSKASNSESFFELSQSQDHYTDKNLQNIPQDKYITNLNLMRDLTSIQNVEVNQDQVVRTVNYFTVEYNNEHLDFTQEYNIGEPENSRKDTESKPNNHRHTEVIFDDETALRIINNCKCCCYMNAGYFNKIEDTDHDVLINNKFKVKTAMDNTEQATTPTEKKMEPSKETVNRDSVAINFGTDSEQRETSEGALMGENRSSTEYTPVKHHWFYRVDVEGKSIWRGFSVIDSKALEEAYHSSDLDDNTLVPTDGGRFDVNVIGRLRIPVYWTEKPTNVRRCSWFYKGTTDARYVPYSESVAEKLEEEYRHGMTTGEWHRRLVLPSNELVVMHGPSVMVHFLQNSNTDAFSGPQLLFSFGKRVYRNPPKIRVSKDQPERIDHLILLVHGAGEYRHQKEKETFQSTMRPRVVRRGYEETEIEDIEPSNIDHLLLLCHGVGSACDMRFRAVEEVGPNYDMKFGAVVEVVDDFRAASLQLIQSHYKNSYENGTVGRVEVLPISWHTTLHSGETGVDRRLARITLDSIPRLRSFTNDTVLDVLFYTSPVFCQTIIDTVCKELNRIYKLFCARNPNFTGGVSLGGHSLGSVILYDLLCHQSPVQSPCQPIPSEKRYISGNAGTGQPFVKYPVLDFEPVALYALGSPIAIFECIRGVESLGADFSLPTCSNFFNIFHPYDPIAYRIEPLIDPHLRHVKPFLIPHHKGRKRMHLELKDTMARVGADIKQKLIESIKTTWSNMWKTQTPPTDRQLEKVVEEEIEKEQLNEEGNKDDQSTDTEISATPEMLGKLNSGRRVDYVLQEAPFEMINEYLFAMSSHVCYWESEDTMLLMLREIYDSLGVQPDSTVPTPGLTVQRTRVPRPEETTVMNVSEHPSTSRDGT